MSLEKGNSIHRKSVKRILDVNKETKQINFMDKRYYTRYEEYYPSITTILAFYPKGKYFEEWLKDVGHNASFIAKRAADEGTQTHSLIERYLNGEEISFLDENDKAICSYDVWRMFLRFIEFWTTHKPKLLESEIHLFSDKFKIAGTCDLVIELNGEIWLIDLKTSNNLHNSFDLQVAAYAQCWNEMFPDKKINRTGILWLKSNKHKPSKVEKKIQGKNWELYVSPRSIKQNWSLFRLIYKIYRLENPKENPYETSFAYVVKKEDQ